MFGFFGLDSEVVCANAGKARIEIDKTQISILLTIALYLMELHTISILYSITKLIPIRQNPHYCYWGFNLDPKDCLPRQQPNQPRWDAFPLWN